MSIVALTLHHPGVGPYIHHFPKSELPDNWLLRGQLLMDWWRRGYITLNEAWRLL